MQFRKKNEDPHVDWSRVGKKTREQINSEAAAEKRALGLQGKCRLFRAHIDGRTYEVPMPDVRAIRERLNLSQVDFAKRFCLSSRTVQQWEQRRAMPDMPARILLRVIERNPELAAQAASDVQHEIKLAAAPE
jgi:putative transcriptional regulator